MAQGKRKDVDRMNRARPRNQAGHDTQRSLTLRMRRGLLALAFTLLLGFALAFSPTVGSELLVTDESSSTLIGFGVLNETGLVLELSSETSAWRVVVVGPDGESASYTALWNGNRVTFESDTGQRYDVADVLARDGRRLTLAWWDGTRVDVASEQFIARPSVSEEDAVEAASGEPAVDPAASNRPASSPATTTSRDDDANDGRDDQQADAPSDPPVADDDDANVPDSNRGGEGNTGDDANDAPDPAPEPDPTDAPSNRG